MQSEIVLSAVSHLISSDEIHIIRAEEDVVYYIIAGMIWSWKKQAKEIFRPVGFLYIASSQMIL